MPAEDKGEFLDLADIEKLTLSQAQTRFNDNFDEIRRLDRKPDLIPEDEMRFAGLVAESDELDKHVKKLNRGAEAARMQAVREGLRTGRIIVEREGSLGGGYDRDSFTEPDSVEDHRFRNPWDLSNIRWGAPSMDRATEFKARARDCIEKMPVATPTIRQAAQTILDKFDDENGALSQQAVLTSDPAYVRAFSKLAKGQRDRLTADETRALDAVESFRAMTLTGSGGGYLVPFQLDPTVINTTSGTSNDIRKYARNVVSTTNVWHGVSAGAVTFAWAAEAAAASDNAPTFAQPTVTCFKGQGFVPISIEALADEQNVAGAIGELLAAGRDNLEAPALCTGTGSGQPNGIVHALTGTGAVTNSATTDTYAAADIYKVFGTLPTRWRRNSSWMGNILTYNLSRQFDTAGGAQLWAQLGDGTPANLLGRPVGIADDMDGVVTGSAENYMLILGDWSQYIIADRLGMTVEFVDQIPDVSTGFPTGQKGWFAHFRMGADLVTANAFKMLDVT